MADDIDENRKRILLYKNGNIIEFEQTSLAPTGTNSGIGLGCSAEKN